MWYSLSSREKVGITSVAALAIGTAGWVGLQKLKAPAVGHPAGLTAGSSSSSFPVHVTGAVREPCLIAGAPNMVVQQAIEAAGGATRDADTNRLNLAARLQPNSRLYVPRLGEDVSEEELGPYAPGARIAASSPAGMPVSGGSAAGGPVNINTASEAELDRLPGVGPVTARKIIEYRNQVGGFKSVEQLMEVKGIGPKKLEKMRPMVGL
jgi:competence protein ComEA